MKKTHQVIATRVSAILLFLTALLAVGPIAQADMAPRSVADHTFAGIRHDRSDVSEIASLAYRLGDYTWGRGHHGTPRQRVNAVVHGLEASRSAGLQGVRACFS